MTTAAAISTPHESTLGIGGKVAPYLACTGETEARLTVHHVLGDDCGAETVIPGDILQKALHVSHHNIAAPHAMTIETHNASGGIVGVTVHSGGDGKASLPTLSRTCVVTQGGGVAAVLHAAAPNATTATREMKFKQIKTDPHGYIPPAELTEETAQRNKLNAVLYAGATGPPTEAEMYRHTITSRNGEAERVAIPIRDSPTAADGTLTHVVSRCFTNKKSTSLLAGADSKVVEMPHKETGELMKHLVVNGAKAAEMAAIVNANTKVAGTLGAGIVIRSHGDIGLPHTKPGDSCVHTITFHRTPVNADGAVAYRSELLPAGAGTVPGLPGGGTANEDAIHKAMWGAQATAGTTIVQSSLGDVPESIITAGADSDDE